MKKYFFLFGLIIFLGCSDDTGHKHDSAKETSSHEEQHASEMGTATLQLNNGAKWKADDPTRKNVAALTQVLNNESFHNESNKEEFVKTFNQQLDTLVQQCRMKGPDHDALHVWLETVMRDLKKVKEGGEYSADYASLKKDVESFNEYFE